MQAGGKHWLVNSFDLQPASSVPCPFFVAPGLYIQSLSPCNMSRGARALGAAFLAFAVWVAILKHVEGNVFNKVLLVRCTLLRLCSIL